MSALTSLFRSFGRHRLFALLNVGGLALGIAAFVVLALYVRFEIGYDRALPGWDRTWIVSEQYTRVGDPSDPNYYTMSGELDQLRGDFPQLQGTRLWNTSFTVLQGDQAIADYAGLVDANFFDLFPYPAIAGDPSRTLRDPDGIVITEKAAKTYFGTASPLGRTLVLRNAGKTYAYRVGAVLRDLPANTSFAEDLFVPLVRARFASEYFDHWGSTSLFTFLRFPDAAAAAAFDRQLPGFLGRHAYPTGNVTKATYYQFLTPLADFHLIDPADRAMVTTLSVVGLLTLIVAIVNYVNLATARAGLRAREVAVRKVLGGTRRALIAQFLGEAIATVGLAALTGLALAELALPFVNSAGGTHLAIRYGGWDGVLLPLAALVIVVGTCAGLYPAFLLSSFRPAAVLASARAPGGGRAGRRLRSALVVFQFAIAIGFAIATGVMLAQTAHVAAADLGFRRDGLIVVRSFADDGLDAAQKAAMLDAFRRVAGVVSVGTGLNAPGDQFSTNSDTLNRPSTPARAPSVSRVDTGPGYFDTVGTRLIAGRMFDAAHPADDRGAMTKEERKRTTANVILNESAVRALGFDSPAAAIGQPISGFNGAASNGGGMSVVGVIADQRFSTPRERVYPTAYIYTTRPFDEEFAMVRYTGDAAATIDRLEAAWKRVAPQAAFGARTAADNLYRRWYKQDDDRARLFTIGAVLAVVIGCIGLYGLAAFDTARRVKEIGIRKTLGASTGDVLRLLLAALMRPVAIANLVAWPVAYVLMRRWLGGFDDRIALSPLFFLAGGLGAAAIAGGTVFAHAWRVARAEPASALRHE